MVTSVKDGRINEKKRNASEVVHSPQPTCHAACVLQSTRQNVRAVLLGVPMAYLDRRGWKARGAICGYRL